VSALAPALQAFFTQRLITQRNASPHTIAAYRDTFRLLLRFAEQQTGKQPFQLDIDDLDAPLIGAFLTHLEQGRGNGPRTRNARLGAIHSFYRYAALEHPEHAHTIARIMAIPTKRHTRNTVSYLDLGEAKALLAAPDRGTWLGRRDHTLLVLMIQTGIRVSELTGLRIGDVHLGVGAHIRVTGKGRKRRSPTLTRETVAVLRVWLTELRGQPDQPLFPTRQGQPLSRYTVAEIVTRHATTAAVGYPSLTAKRTTPHTLRHTNAMLLRAQGVDIATIALWLGHFSGDSGTSPGVSFRVCQRCLCRTFSPPCATWISAQDMASDVPREGVACRADRHPRLLDGGRSGLGAGPGRGRLFASSAAGS